MVEPNETIPPEGGSATLEEPARGAVLKTGEIAIGTEAQRFLRGHTAPAKAASRAVVALCHAAASFNLYDAGNEAVAAFIAELQESFASFLRTYGDLDIQIHPWEISYNNEVVFVERDPDRSLAFRLYRDGVRRLVIHPSVDWEEVVALLGILAIRAKGFRQHEDDVVTMLWNAGFSQIGFEAVEGLVAEDDERDPALAEAALAGGPKTSAQALAYTAPYVFDYPLPPLTAPEKVLYRVIQPAYLERVRQQDSVDALPGDCAQLVDELIALVQAPNDPLSIDDLAPLVREIRSYMLSDGKVPEYATLLKMLLGHSDLDTELREGLIAAFADTEAVRRLLDLAGNKSDIAPQDVLETAALIPGDHLKALVSFLSGTPPERTRNIALKLVEHQVSSQPQRIMEQLLASPERADLELFRLLAAASPTHASEVALAFLSSSNHDLRVESLKVLGVAPYGPKVGRALVGVLRAGEEEIRRQALAILVEHRERRAWDNILESLTSPAEGKISLAEAAGLGEALARLEPAKAAPVFHGWVKPAGLLGRLANVPVAVRVAAISGLSLLPGKESKELLEHVVSKGSPDLQQLAKAALTRLAKGA